MLFRRSERGIEVLLGHMGGPIWGHKHKHSWSIPKGLHEADERDALAVAEREFEEEMGSVAPSGESIELGSVRGVYKTITIFAREGDFDAARATSNTFEMEWPPRSGQIGVFPEIDRAEWVLTPDAPLYLTKSQGPFIDRLLEAIS